MLRRPIEECFQQYNRYRLEPHPSKISNENCTLSAFQSLKPFDFPILIPHPACFFIVSARWRCHPPPANSTTSVPPGKRLSFLSSTPKELSIGSSNYLFYCSRRFMDHRLSLVDLCLPQWALAKYLGLEESPFFSRTHLLFPHPIPISCEFAVVLLAMLSSFLI